MATSLVTLVDALFTGTCSGETYQRGLWLRDLLSVMKNEAARKLKPMIFVSFLFSNTSQDSTKIRKQYDKSGNIPIFLQAYS